MQAGIGEIIGIIMLIVDITCYMILNGVEANLMSGSGKGISHGGADGACSGEKDIGFFGVQVRFLSGKDKEK